QLQPADSLLAPLDQVYPFSYDQLLAGETDIPVVQETATPVAEQEAKIGREEKPEDPLVERHEASDVPQHRPAAGIKAIDPALAWAKFESEEYGFMKGNAGRLSESVGLNQKFMFTKVL